EHHARQWGGVPTAARRRAHCQPGEEGGTEGPSGVCMRGGPTLRRRVRRGRPLSVRQRAAGLRRHSLLPGVALRASNESEAGRGGHGSAMIIDAHCHAGLGDGLTGPWDTEARLRGYLPRAMAAGIDRIVLFAAFHSDYVIANREVARIVATQPTRYY